MDSDQFDRITHRTAGTTRRGVVSSLVAGVTALLLGADRLTAEPGGNGKGNGNGQERGIGQQPETPPGISQKPEKTPGSGKSNGKGQTKTPGTGKGPKTAKAKGKVWLCHKPTPAINPTTGLLDASRRQGVVIQVAASARGGPNRKNKLRGHLGHGDVECQVLPAVTTPGQSPAFVTGSACVVEEQAITNAAGIVETSRSVTCTTSALVTPS